MDYMYNSFKNLKELFKDYQAYVSGYDPHQYGSHPNDSDFKFHPTTKTWNITKLVSRKERMKALPSNIAYNVAHTFAYGAFAVANYICSQKPGSSPDYDNDAFDADILSRGTYIDEERPLDDSWDLVDYYYLLVEFPIPILHQSLQVIYFFAQPKTTPDLFQSNILQIYLKKSSVRFITRT